MNIQTVPELMRSPLFGLTVHHVDEHLLVVDKPSGVLMHRTHPRPQISLLEMVRREMWDTPGADADRIEVVHRLDRETSGLVVLARTKQAARELSGLFHARQVKKAYRAIVHGRVETGGEMDAPIGRAVGSQVKKKRQINGPDAKPCRTRFEVLETIGDFTHLQVTPETGRQHQIRIHLAALGHPLLGDKLYGPDERWHLRYRETGWDKNMADALIFPRHALHASELEFIHPVTCAPLHFVSPLPDDMAGFDGSVKPS